MSTIPAKITKARIGLIKRQPFFGTLALRLKVVEDATLNPPTMATDGRRMIFHPEFLEKSDQQKIEFVVAHEVGHCALNHVTRRGARSPKRWNWAIDFAVNEMLHDCGFQVPDDALYNPGFKGMSAEQIYNLLPPEDEDGNQGGGGNSKPGQGPVDQHFDAKDDPTLPAELEVATIQAAQAQRGRGTMPNSLKRFCPDLAEAKVDWRTVLRRFATEAAKNDYSWVRPNRMWLSQGVILPGLHSESVRDLTKVIDTSGSVDAATLAAFGGEIDDIRNSCELEMSRVMYCDAAVNHVDEFEKHDQLLIEPHGGGGTDFRPPFRWLEKRQIQPTALIYLTDGYGPFPDSPPPYPVLWVMTTDVVPPWGEHVRIEL